MIAEHDGQPRHTLPPNQSHFDLLAIGLNSDDGREAAVREVDRFNPLVGLFESFPQAKRHGCEMRLQQVKVIRWVRHDHCSIFNGAFDPDDIRIALSLGPGVPIVLCDARDRDSVKHVLVSLVRYVMSGSRRPDRMSLG